VCTFREEPAQPFGRLGDRVRSSHADDIETVALGFDAERRLDLTRAERGTIVR
jgi:hypothetical protein